MSEDVAIAAPSAVDAPIEIPRANTPEYAEWRKSGTLPAKTSEAKTVEPPATDTLKEETAVEPEPAAGKQQESRRKPDAEARIRELTERQRQLEKELEEARKPKEAKADPPPARQPEANAKPTVNDKNADGSLKFKDYEEFVEALSDWKTEQKLVKRDQEQAQAKQLESFEKEVGAARGRYADFDAKAIPFAQELITQGTPQYLVDAVKDSPVMHDLLYTIGADDSTRADFLKTARESPNKAMRVLLIMEQSIQAELAKGKESTERNDKGQFKPAETPAKRGPDSAPNPPIEIGNRGGLPRNEASDAAEKGDFAAFARIRDAQDRQRSKGA